MQKVQQKEEYNLRQSLSKELLMEYTNEISQYVRLSGTKEEEKAFYYVKETLESFGLEPELTWSEALISLPEEAYIQKGSQKISVITHSMAAPANDLAGEIVRITDRNKIPRASKESQFILLEGLATPGIVREVEEAGFEGCICINTSRTYEMIVSPVWGMPTPEKSEELPKIPVLSLTKGSAEQLANGDFVQLYSTVDTRIRRIPTLTVDILAGNETKDFVLFSGHIDSWHYGAMDNGTANAVIIEVARVLSQRTENLQRNLRLAFWSGHSHGRYAGSTSYSEENWQELYDHCIAHVNVDSLGGKGSTVLSQANCMAETKNVATYAVGQITGETFEGKRYGKAGDQSFWGAGVPSLYMGLSEQPPSPGEDAHSELFGTGKSSGFGWWWHTTEDTIDKVDPDFLLRDGEVYLLSILTLLESEEIPIDQEAALQDIHKGLEMWDKKAGEHLSLQPLIKQTEAVYQHFIKAKEHRHCSSEWNELVVRLSKFLVPVNYVAEDRFDYDTLFQLPQVPALKGIDRLIQIPKEDNEYWYTKAKVKRKMNELLYLLKEAERSIQHYRGEEKG